MVSPIFCRIFWRKSFSFEYLYFRPLTIDFEGLLDKLVTLTEIADVGHHLLSIQVSPYGLILTLAIMVFTGST